MRVLITGSSGQIGTNLALRLLREGHEVFGVDKRQNTWTDAFPTLLQDLAGHYAPFPGGINGVEYPETDLVVHLAAHAKVHQLVGEPHRALENAVMTFNVLEYARHGSIPIVFSSSREVYGDVHRFEGYDETARRLRLHREHLLGLEDRRRGLRLFVRPLLRPPLSRLPLLQRLRPLRQRSPPHGPRHPALHPLARARGADHDLRRPRQDSRLHVRGRLRGRHHARGRSTRRGQGRQRDDQPRLRGGQHARPLRRADRPRARGRGGHDPCAVPARRGDALRRRPLEGTLTARLRPPGSTRRGNRARGRVVPRPPRTSSRRRTCPYGQTTSGHRSSGRAGRRRPFR